METHFEAVQKKEWNGKTPIFRTIAGKSPYEYQQPSTPRQQKPSTSTLEDDLYLSDSEISILNNTPQYITNDYGYIMDLTQEDHIDLTIQAAVMKLFVQMSYRKNYGTDMCLYTQFTTFLTKILITQS